MKTLFFLSGLPRSGSTLLGSILSQHPEIQATATSPLADLLCLIDEGFSKIDLQYTYDKEKVQYNTYNSILENFYNHIDKPYILDKHRGWPKNIKSIEKFLHQSPKIIATNRRISEILASYILLIRRNNEADNFIDAHLRRDGKQITTDNRIDCLWKNYLSEAYETLVYGLTHNRDNIHLIDYNDLVQYPEKELSKVYNFFGVSNTTNNLSNIYNTCAEDKDYAWGIDNLHKIRTKLERISPPPEEVIGEENVKFYDQFNI
jgi:sulfotransferase